MNSALRAWQERTGLSDRKAAVALGVSYGSFTGMLGTRFKGQPSKDIDTRTALACAAIEAGLAPDIPEWADRRTVLALAAHGQGIKPIR